MTTPTPPGQVLPKWFYLGRAVLGLAAGLLMVVNEAVGDGPGRVLIILAGLLLVGFAPADLVAFWKGRNGNGGGD